jgi:hypothetical protein
METVQCFCLFSSGPLGKIIEENHKTVLHQIWKKEFFFEKDTSTASGRKFSLIRVGQAALAYPLGMIGYFIDSLRKIILLIGNGLALLGSVISHHPSRMRARALVALDNLLAASISIIGTLIPPLGYTLDRKAKETMIASSLKFQTVQ